MPELSPGVLLSFATSAALDDHRHRYRCPSDNDDIDFAASSATTVTLLPAAGASPTSSAAADCSAFFVCHHHRRLNDASSSAAADHRNDSAKEPAAVGRPSVFRETLRGRAHGARLPVHILLHALPEFTDCEVYLLYFIMTYK